MIVAERLRQLRTDKGMSQGEVEKRTGLLRCYISRVENGHTVPAVETLEKFARALEVPLYHLFVDPSKERPDMSMKSITSKPTEDDPTTVAICKALKTVPQRDRKLVLRFVQSISKGARRAA
jgi:transcriptional regulator with XRE-family HTH domain